MQTTMSPAAARSPIINAACWPTFARRPMTRTDGCRDALPSSTRTLSSRLASSTAMTSYVHPSASHVVTMRSRVSPTMAALL